MKPGDSVKWIGQLVVNGRSESTVFIGTVERARPEGQVVVRVKTPESQVGRLIVGAPSDFREVTS